MTLIEPIITPSMVAREHIAYCIGRGMTPREVCESVSVFLTRPTWADAERVIAMRWQQMQASKGPLPVITERRLS